MREKRDMERSVGTGHGSARSRARASPVQPATAEVCGLPRGSGLSLWSAALCRSVSSLTCRMRSSSPARRVGNTQAHSQMATPQPCCAISRGAGWALSSQGRHPAALGCTGLPPTAHGALLGNGIQVAPRRCHTAPGS